MPIQSIYNSASFFFLLFAIAVLLVIISYELYRRSPKQQKSS